MVLRVCSKKRSVRKKRKMSGERGRNGLQCITDVEAPPL